MKLPDVWSRPMPELIVDRMKNEAANLFALHNFIPEDLKAFRRETLAKLSEAIGFSVDHRLPLDPEFTGTVRRNGYRIEKVCFQSAPFRYVTGCLYIPDGAGPFPAVLNVHGHHITGHLAPAVQQRGHILAQNGFVCLSVDAFGSGERATKHGSFEFHGGHRGFLLNNVGETLLGIQIADNMRAIDLLCSLPYVDPERIGVTGASGGGNQTMWVTAFDDRVKAAVSVVSVGTFRSYIMGHNCICETVPGGMTLCEEAGLIACIAPRAYAMYNALYDQYSTFVPSEMLDTWKIAKKAWESAGVPENLSYRIFPTVHGFKDDARKCMLGFFTRHLKGVGFGDPVEEPEVVPMTEDEAMVYPRGKAPEKLTGILTYCGKIAEKRKAERAGLSPEERRKGLEKVLNSAPVSVTEVCGGSFEDGWEKLTLRTSHGFMIPALLKGSAGGKWRILSGACGKKTLENQAYLKESADSGDGLLVFDVFGSGERGDEYGCPTQLDYANFSRSAIFLGWTMMGEWVREYTAVADWLRREKKAEKITAYGFRDAAAAALLSAALYGKFDRIVMDTAPATFNWSEFDVSDFLITTMAFSVTGILRFGDMDDFIELAKPAVTEWIGPRTFSAS